MYEHLRSLRGGEYRMHPLDAADEYEKQTLAVEQLLAEIKSVREKHGEAWADNMSAGTWVAEPDELLINMMEQFESAGRTLVRRIAAWEEGRAKEGK